MAENRGLVPLAAELFDRIIDFLCYDKEALQACSLVCHQWLPCSRFHLFYTAYLFGSARESRAKRLIEIAPTIGPYIRSLEAYDCALITPVSSHLKNIAHVALVDTERLHLSSLLSTCPSIKSLQLRYSTLSGFADTNNLFREQTLAGRVETLQISGINSGLAEFLLWARSIDLLSRLRTIKFRSSYSEPASTFKGIFCPLLCQIGANLVTLSLDSLSFECSESLLSILGSFKDLETFFVSPELFDLEGSKQMNWLLDTIPAIVHHIESQKMSRIELNLRFNPISFTDWPKFEDRFNSMWTDVSYMLVTTQFEACRTGVNFELRPGGSHPSLISYSPLLPWIGGQSSWRDFLPAHAIADLLVLSSSSNA